MSKNTDTQKIETFIDDKIEHIEDDIKKVQTKPKNIGPSYSNM